MSPQSQWRESTRRVLDARGLSIPDLARLMGADERGLRRWMREGRRLRDEYAIVSRIADALGVPMWWLHEPYGDVPRGPSAPWDAIKMFPPEMRRVALAFYDPPTFAFLARMLDEYDRMRARGEPPKPAPRARPSHRSR